MTVNEIITECGLEVLNIGGKDATITGVYCCDLLSVVMGKAFGGCAWVTVMGNINSIAVASLADMGCIILADNVTIDDHTLQKAVQQGVTVLKSKLPVFETALKIHETCEAER